MNAFKLENLLKELNIYEFDFFKDSNNYLEFFLIINYSYEFLDIGNYEFERYLKEKCFFEYDNVMHSRLTFAPEVRVECKIWSKEKVLNSSNFESKFDFFVSFPNGPRNLKIEDDLKTKYIDLTKAFVIRILKEAFV